jgi:hypothetical protein
MVSTNTVYYDDICDTMSGDGLSAATAYMIDTPSRLQNCLPHKDGVGVYFKMPTTGTLNASSLTASLPTFYGILDGQGTTISAMAFSGNGLFVGIDGGSVQNLNISSPNITCFQPCGMLAGTATNSAVIQNVSLVGTTTITTGANDVGGLVGKGMNGSRMIGNLVQNLTINSTFSSSRVGGLVGSFEKNTNTGSPDFYQNRIVTSQFGAGACASDAGGMIGQVSSTAVGTVITIDQNAVDFSLPCGSAGANRIGGAVGTVTNPGNYASVTMTFKNLNVVGAISNTAGNWYGGIIGIGVANESGRTDIAIAEKK